MLEQELQRLKVKGKFPYKPKSKRYKSRLSVDNLSGAEVENICLREG